MYLKDMKNQQQKNKIILCPIQRRVKLFELLCIENDLALL
jgi:hypothetical protein